MEEHGCDLDCAVGGENETAPARHVLREDRAWCSLVAGTDLGAAFGGGCLAFGKKNPPNFTLCQR